MGILKRLFAMLRSPTFVALSGGIGALFLLSAPITYWSVDGADAWFFAKLFVGGIGTVYYLLRRGAAHTEKTRAAGVGGGWLVVLRVVAVMVCVVAVNAVAYYNDRVWDVTAGDTQSLSAPSSALLATLNERVDILAFYAPHEGERRKARVLLQRYADGAENIHVRFIDPEARPDLTRRYAIRADGPRLVLSDGHGEQSVDGLNEEALTNALQRLVSGDAPTLHFLVGHGERDLAGDSSEAYAKLAQTLDAAGYTVRTLDLRAAMAANAEAPAHVLGPDVRILLIADPIRPLMPAELQALEDFVEHGGRLFVLLEPGRRSGLATLLARWRIGVGDVRIVDPIGQVIGLGYEGIVGSLTEPRHGALQELRGNTIMHGAASLIVNAVGQRSFDVIGIIETSTSAWGETQENNRTPTLDAADTPPPLLLGVLAGNDDVHGHAETEAASAQSRIAVFGDADWLSDRLFDTQANREVFLATLAWVSAAEHGLRIPPKRRSAEQLALSRSRRQVLRLLTTDILPLMILAIGVWVAMRRRHRRQG